MKRIVGVLVLVIPPLVGFAPPAHAVGYGACTIVGTITFTAKTATSGTWTIGPGTLDCQGVIGKRGRIIGRGPFRGSGTYTALPPGDGACLRQSGTGKVEYVIPTFNGRISVTESQSHTLVGAGIFDTDSLHGTFQVPPPYDGDCLTKPVSRAAFVAQVMLYRYPREYPPALPFV